MSGPGAVVVGASVAGVRTVQALRRRGYDAPITLVSAEQHPPYDRPPLSKAVLVGGADHGAIALLAANDAADLDVDLRLGTAARDVDLDARTVRVGDDMLTYRHLVVATGSVPRRLPTALAGVHVLRTLDDATAVRDALQAGARVVVVGGGFIGAEVAVAARSLGLDTTVVDPLPALMIRGLGRGLGMVMSRRHADEGVRLRLGRTVARLEGGERVETVVLDDGERLAADLVVVGIGVDPATDWLRTSGLDVSRGLVADAILHAGRGVYGVGDVVNSAGVRLEHWTNATDQAAALGATLTGTPTPYSAVPFVWSDQWGRRLQILGDVRPDDEPVFLHGDAGSEEFVAAVRRDDGIGAVVSFGARREAMKAQRLLRSGATWEPGAVPALA